MARFDIVFVKDTFGDLVRRANEPIWIVSHLSLFDSLRPIIRIFRKADYLVRFERYCGDDSRTYIGTSPALAATPELDPDRKLTVLHGGGEYDARAEHDARQRLKCTVYVSR